MILVTFTLLLAEPVLEESLGPGESEPALPPQQLPDSMREHHQPQSDTKNKAGPRIISLEERFHITPAPVRDSLHRENLRPHVSHADPNIIVLTRTESRGKFLTSRQRRYFLLKIGLLEYGINGD
jgi:hypothetical protein